ncbi:hypothetical protein ACFQI7_21215 [Paenibacillus allorhizosphaerae]|uniref:Uncharacterized protein n=1 Tax=Paenibacillus allorhizosphaerae TaxID=2849866 RepID=A0ABM8VRD9_9BACL|nr:hypothetical protein [Paenibacillus allorhizosphaerae]CAG7655187.1 hypothetical protein PAECIP111802_06036 [Paenibacillus allorhizosphaerae]
MYRSPKERIAAMPEQQLLAGALQDTQALLATDMTDTELSAAHTSGQEQMKQTPRKSYR